MDIDMRTFFEFDDYNMAINIDRIVSIDPKGEFQYSFIVRCDSKKMIKLFSERYMLNSIEYEKGEYDDKKDTYILRNNEYWKYELKCNFSSKRFFTWVELRKTLIKEVKKLIQQ